MSSRARTQAAKRRTTFRRTTKPDDPRNRLIALLALFVIIGAGFVALLVDLQTVRSEDYRSIGEDQRTRTRQLTGYRGAVLDRNGFVLATSVPSHRLVADPTLIAEPAETAALLAPILDQEEASLATQLTPDTARDQFSLLATALDDEVVARIEEMELADETSEALVGVWLRPEENRIYPAGDLAGAIVGRVDPDRRGIFGVEEQFDELMTGVPGVEQFEGGRFGSISGGDRMVDPAIAGYNVALTLDHRIQYVTEQALIEHCDAARAKGATAVMADPTSGHILAMASVSRNEKGGCEVTNYNGALVDSFEPGSVVKPVVVAAATQELGYTSESLVDVPSRLSVGGKTFIDHPEHAAAPYPISEILAKSMNVGTILLSQRLAPETIYDYMTAFGFGQASGLGFDGESRGKLRSPDQWWGADHGSIPIGQGMTTTAVQLLSVYNVIANGGNFVAPVLVESIETSDGTDLEEGEEATPIRSVVSPTTTQEVTDSLVAVVNRGTGTAAAVDGYQVAGKTGTAWKVFDDGSGQSGYGSDGHRRYVVSFAGFLPAENPVLSMVVVVDEPKRDTTAAAIAAPLFSEIASYAMRILAVPTADMLSAEGDRVRAAAAGSRLTPAERDRLGLELAAAVASPTAADVEANP
ncbi:MAG: penicillin-binding protein 2 [Actinomycetia bacterium]|nr:penicillin-binding protein 2 [Actinomycetes bacterium]